MVKITQSHYPDQVGTFADPGAGYHAKPAVFEGTEERKQR
jgi:hypothetical protein